MSRWSLIRLRFAVPSPFLALDFAGSGDEALGGFVLGLQPFLAPTFFCLFDDIDFGPRRNQNGSSSLPGGSAQHYTPALATFTVRTRHFWRACLPFLASENQHQKKTSCRAFFLLVSWSQASTRLGCALDASGFPPWLFATQDNNKPTFHDEVTRLRHLPWRSGSLIFAFSTFALGAVVCLWAGAACRVWSFWRLEESDCTPR